MASPKQTRNSDTGMAHAVGSKEYNLVHHYLDIFEYAYDRYRPTLERLISLNNSYENVIDEKIFPTISKMSIPNHFGMVQEALPNALDYVFPDGQKTFELTPLDVDMDMETLDKVEWALNFQIRNRMKAKWRCLPAIQDAIKTGIGYSGITTYNTTPLQTMNKRFLSQGRVVAQTRQLGLGDKRKTAIIENVGLGEVIPTDDGSDFNGPDAVSYVFRIKLYKEGEFRRLFKSVKNDAEDVDVKGDVERIIEEAKEYNYTTNVPYQNIIASLGGHDLTRKRMSDRHEFVMIPVIRCYGEQEVVWIANGTTVIYHEKDTVQSLHRPLVKASITVDQNKWHPMNPAEAGQAIANGKNLYANLLMDMIIRAVKPVAVYDKSRFGNRPPRAGVDGWIGVDGRTDGAIDWQNPQQMNNGHVAFDNMLDRMYGHAVGQSASMQDPSAGLVRGGLHAFESLLNTMYGRQRLASMVMDMGYLEPLGQLALINMQLMATGEGVTFAEREYDQDTGKGHIRKLSVSFDDLNTAYDVSLDTRGKARNETDLNERVTIFNAVRDDPYFDPYTTREFLVGAYPSLRTGLYSREKARQIQEQQAEQARQEQQAAAGGTNNVPGGTPQAIEQGAQLGGLPEGV